METNQSQTDYWLEKRYDALRALEYANKQLERLVMSQTVEVEIQK